MGQVNLDLSEYQALQENKRLLQESLKKERALHEKMEELRIEKVKVLEDAQQKVLKVVRREIHEHKTLIRPIEDILSNLERIRYQNERFRMGRSFGGSSLDDYYAEFIESCFDTIRVVTGNSIEDETTETSFIGFDEAKKELKEKFLEELDNDVKKSLDSYNHLQKRVTALNESLNQEKELNKRLVEDLEKAEKKLLDFNLVFQERDFLRKQLARISNLTRGGATLFGNGMTVNAVCNITEESFRFEESENH